MVLITVVWFSLEMLRYNLIFNVLLTSNIHFQFLLKTFSSRWAGWVERNATGAVLNNDFRTDKIASPAVSGLNADDGEIFASNMLKRDEKNPVVISGPQTHTITDSSIQSRNTVKQLTAILLVNKDFLSSNLRAFRQAIFILPSWGQNVHS